MNKFNRFLSLALLALLVSASASAQVWRGMGRLQGIVTDQQGQPVKGAKVVLLSVKGSNTGPEPILTDAKGKWVAGGLIGGMWNIDITADGFITRQISANVSELERLTPAMKIELEKKPEERPAPPPAEAAAREAVVVGGVEITPEIAKGIEDANNAMKEEKWVTAIAGYEPAVAVLPSNTQLKFALARAYYGASKQKVVSVEQAKTADGTTLLATESPDFLKKAVAQLQDVYNADTGNVMAASLLADMLLEDGQLDAGKKVLADMPPGSISDPNTIINIGIRFVNNNRPEDALKYFDDAVSVAPDMPAAYYFRGVAALQLKKMKEAKADLQKVVSLAPDSTEAADAKDLLAQMK